MSFQHKLDQIIKSIITWKKRNKDRKKGFYNLAKQALKYCLSH